MTALLPHQATPPAQALQFQVQGEFDVAAVIAGTTRFCAAHGASTVLAAHVATAASELANNLWMYAERGGQVQLRLLQRGPQRGIELLCQDDGPGMADPALALTEGFSTGGGMGCGLPGVRRLMDDFQLDTLPGIGTRVTATKWWQPRT
jgi:serine/threonine-protein kinase RsbT